MSYLLKKMRCGTISFYFFKHKCVNLFVNAAVGALDKVLTKHCRATIINVALEECLRSLGFQQILESFLFSSLTSRLNIVFNDAL